MSTNDFGAQARSIAADLATIIEENIAAGRCADRPLFWAEQRAFWGQVRDGS
ncbi:hypothetical protein HQQ88_04910 [Curtobacterium sp. VKM Ac-2861]|uniref:hypothetical protein n=1 Tax=Curtobacterium sp. VKM Ac-2861 TaxID=2739016 RepID=UPI0015642FAB|nr:hypothetical protein [Curtobacterium sp. VKM Ac-2861]